MSRKVEIICETATCVAFYDGYPVSPGHALIIPKRHVASYFDLTHHKREAMNGVLQYVKQKVDERYHPDGYNIGINVNEAAGQSVSLDHNIIHLFLIKIYCDIDVKVISLLMQGISLHIGYRSSKWMRALAGEHIAAQFRSCLTDCMVEAYLSCRINNE